MTNNQDSSHEDDSDAPDTSGNNAKNRKYKKGGKVHGEMSKKRLDKRARGGEESGHWIAGAIKRPGALHRKLHVPEGEKIPAGKLAKAAHSSNPTERKEAALAKTLKGFHKK